MLQIWENFVEGEEVSNGVAVERRQKEELKVCHVISLGIFSSFSWDPH